MLEYWLNGFQSCPSVLGRYLLDAYLTYRPTMNDLIRKLLPRSLHIFIVGIVNGIHRYWIPKHKFGFLSSSAKIAVPISIINPKNVFLYDECSIGSHSIIMAKNAKFIMKKQSVSAGRLTVVTGNHARIKGNFLLSIKENEKPAGLDHDVVINEDVWMGLNVTILSGVVIGRGCTIAAGSVVTKSLPPYTVAAGIPAKILKFYWTPEEIIEHEKEIYEASERFTIEELKAFRLSHNI